MTTRRRALIVIDIQNDYFPGGNYPLWNAEQTLRNIEDAMGRAQARGVPLVLVQHVARGAAPFFNADTPGVDLHPAVQAVLPQAQLVTKGFADSFHETDLEAVLRRLGTEELLLCGMMTQNCVAHTAISKMAERYAVAVLADCCTSVDAMIHAMALRALSTRIAVVSSTECL